MSIHINRFIDKVSGAESKNLKDLHMTITEARNLHNDITKLLLALRVLQQYTVMDKDTGVQQVEITGGSFEKINGADN